MYSTNNIDKAKTLTGKLSQGNVDLEWVAPEMGANGITVTKTVHTKDGETTVTTHQLPPIGGRYDKGDGVIYKIPNAAGDGFYHLDVEQLSKPAAWAKRGNRKEARAMKDPLMQDIWYEVAEQWPLTGASPTLRDGLPPQAPLSIQPQQSDEELAKECLREGLHRCSPTGRGVLGLALLSPWIGMLNETPPMIVHLVGEGGMGKSLMARVAASLFGPMNGRKSLFGGFDSSPQGVPTYAQSLSYFPVILDESNAMGAPVEQILRSLMTGVERKKSSRQSNYRESNAGWKGLALTTGNDPLPTNHEMFDRRALEIQIPLIWDKSQMPITEVALSTWFRETGKMFETAAGWAWQGLMNEYPMGTDKVDEMTTIINSLEKRDMNGDLGDVVRLALVGVCWLAHYLDDPSLLIGVEQAMSLQAVIKRSKKTDAAREVADSILEDYDLHPNLWYVDLERPAAALNGWPAVNVPRDINCSLSHDNRNCEWLDVLAAAMPKLVPHITPERMSVNPRLLGAMYRPTGTFSRRVSMKSQGGQKKVNTFCLNGLLELAEQMVPTKEDFDLSPQLYPFPVEVRQLEGTGFVKELEMTTTVENVEKTPTVIDPKSNHKFTVSEIASREVAEAAVRDGFTDLIIPADKAIREIIENGDNAEDGDKWTSRNNWNAAAGTVKKGDVKLRVWRAAPEQSLEEAQAAIEGMLELDPEFTTVAELAQRLMRNAYQGTNAKTPRMQLDPEVADLWKNEGILHPDHWGPNFRQRKEMDLNEIDKSRAYLAALTTVNVAPLLYGEQWTEFGSEAPVDRKWAGMYKITVPEWDNPHLPSPSGWVEAGVVKWTTAEIMRLYGELGITPEIHRAMLAPVHRVAGLDNLVKVVREWLDETEGTPTQRIVKSVYQCIAGTLASDEWSRNVPNHHYRPDWAQAIKDNSWANVLRQAYKTYNADNKYVPTSVNVDALFYDKSLPLPIPEIPMGNKLGQYKNKTH